MPTTGLEKAIISSLDFSSEKVTCLFNPKEYTFSKQNQYKPKKTTGGNVPQFTFEGGGAATLDMELFFDTYADSTPGEPAKDVRKEYTDKIWRLMYVDERLKDKKSKKARPPRVRFQWGESWGFNAVITKISQKFTLFAQDGTPLRATLNVGFQQEKDSETLQKQNPTSGGMGGERFWTVEEGDTLGWIAYQEYGETSMWRVIAEANDLDNVRELSAGTVLLIPNA
jgi:nucleoid-associated protein YgaU